MEIKISFGQTWSMQNMLEKNLISLVIIPSAANYLLHKVSENSPIRSYHENYCSMQFLVDLDRNGCIFIHQSQVRERNHALISINNSILDSGPSSDDRLAERVTRDSEEYVDELISQLLTQEDCTRFQVDDVKRPDEGVYKPAFYPQDVDMEVTGFDV